MQGTVKKATGRRAVCKRWRILLAVVATLSAGCKSVEPGVGERTGIPACYVVYDVGSSRSRLFIYEQTAMGWSMHRGPGTAALADPVRGNRGKTMADAGGTVDELVAALDDIRFAGPPGRDGIPRWLAFDWKRRCQVEAAYVYGTAGMRIAEAQDLSASDLVWKQVRKKLAGKLGAPVTARTLSEFEEGLFAWLALSETLADTRFGVAELGGGSLQVTFPCRDCQGARKVTVRDRSMAVYSHSFLGWGQDEAWKALGQVAACQRGAGVADPGWTAADCEAVMQGFAHVAATVAGHIEATQGLRWYLSDAFFYMQADDIWNFCQEGLDSGFEPESSCFRAVYQRYVMRRLALPPDAEKSAVNWTLGALVCTVTQCLGTRLAD